jgi:hypothetical protein
VAQISWAKVASMVKIVEKSPPSQMKSKVLQS